MRAEARGRITSGEGGSAQEGVAPASIADLIARERKRLWRNTRSGGTRPQARTRDPAASDVTLPRTPISPAVMIHAPARATLMLWLRTRRDIRVISTISA